MQVSFFDFRVTIYRFAGPATKEKNGENSNQGSSTRYINEALRRFFLIIR
jgi:hypothetical protein